jgi:hypothetical protein
LRRRTDVFEKLVFTRISVLCHNIVVKLEITEEVIDRQPPEAQAIIRWLAG